MAFEERRPTNLWKYRAVKTLRGGGQINQLKYAGDVADCGTERLPIRQRDIFHKLYPVGATEHVFARDTVRSVAEGGDKKARRGPIVHGHSHRIGVGDESARAFGLGHKWVNAKRWVAPSITKNSFRMVKK